MFKIRKLNARGVAHHAVLMLVVVLAVGGFGAYTVFQSNADALNTADYTLKVNTANGCWLAGRVWNTTTTSCTATCRVSTTTYVANGTKPGYCTGQVATTMTADTCVQNEHRIYLYNLGCARKNDQESSNNSRRCTGWSGYTNKSVYSNYVADYYNDGGVDKCVQPTVATTTQVANSDSISNTYCTLLGRTGSNGNCNRACANSRETLLKNADGVYYCNLSIANMTPASCSATFRVYVVVSGHNIGCARRPNQDSATDKLRCQTNAGYSFYMGIPGGTDYCLKSAPIINWPNNNPLQSSTGSGSNSGSTGTAGSGLPTQPTSFPSIIAGIGMLDKVETGLSKSTCQQLLGRQWDPKFGAVPAGCSESICVATTAKLRVEMQPSNGSWYCQGYATQLDQNTCGNLHRKWLPSVSACAAIPDYKHKASVTKPVTIIRADQCLKPYTTYVQRDGTSDSCKQPNTIQVLNGVTQITVHPFTSLFSLPAKGLCALRSDKIYVAGHCVNQPKPVLGTTTS